MATSQKQKNKDGNYILLKNIIKNKFFKINQINNKPVC
ncbi:hypothetical protein PSOL_00370 [Candidatus Phytoplasma solani]